MSTGANTQYIETISEAAKNGNGDFVKLTTEGVEQWLAAIQGFIDVIDGDRVNGKLTAIRQYSNRVTTYLSATDTRKALAATAPDEVEQAIKAYRDYLEALKTAVYESYKRIHGVDYQAQ